MTKLLIAAIAALIVLVSSGCRSQEAIDAWDELEAQRTAAIADGVVTPEEATALADKLGEIYQIEKEDLSSIDWATLLPTALGTVLASILGTNIYRNRSLPCTHRKASA